jgi:hypothetical protein
MRSENMKKYQDFSASPRLAIYEKKKKKISIRAVGSVCKPTGILNRSAGSEAIHA